MVKLTEYGEEYFTSSVLTEDIARQLFFVDWDREHITNLVDSSDWSVCPEHLKDRYREEATEICAILKDWLRAVGIPEGTSVEDTLQLLVTLVDEP